jgi:hypothetical protein
MSFVTGLLVAMGLALLVIFSAIGLAAYRIWRDYRGKAAK